jgi:hypothetical protein
MGRPKRKLNYYISAVGVWDKGDGKVWNSEHRYTFSKAVQFAKKLATKGFKEIEIERRTKRYTVTFDYIGEG